MIKLTLGLSALAFAATIATAEAGPWRKLDRLEDRLDRIEDRVDRRVNRGPRDRLEDRIDQFENRVDRRTGPYAPAKRRWIRRSHQTVESDT